MQDFKKLPQPQYIGNKDRVIEWIFFNTPKSKSIFDAFSGSSSVGYFFKRKGLTVYSNDLLASSFYVAKAMIENNNITLNNNDIKMLLSDNKHSDTFIADNFSDIYYTFEECRFLDNLRTNINNLDDDYKKALAFTAAYRTMTRKVLFGYFLHTRALSYRTDKSRVTRNPSIEQNMKDLFLKMVDVYNAAVFDNGRDNKAMQGNVLDIIKDIKVDTAYFDPPYVGLHPDYQGYYHFLETFTYYWKDMKLINSTKMYADKKYSGFTKKSEIVYNLQRLFENASEIKNWIISYNSRAFPDKDTMLNLIGQFRKVKLIKYRYTSNFGGMGAKKNSEEYLFVC